MASSAVSSVNAIVRISTATSSGKTITGATAANPETGTCTLPTGDTILFANLFAGTAPGLLKITLTRNN